VITPPCPYCESIVNPPIIKDDLTHCEFCNDYIHCSQGGKGKKSLYYLVDYEFMNIDPLYPKKLRHVLLATSSPLLPS